MRPRQLRRRLTLAAFGAVLAGTVLGTGIAKADPMTVEDYAFRNATAICGMIDQQPDIGGLMDVGTRLMQNGLTPEQAATVVVLAVDNVCPRFIPLLQSVASAPPSAPANSLVIT
jgi:hypothetical protein